LTDALGEHQGADVGGLPKYAGGGIRSHAVLPGVADGNTSHFNGARHLQHLVRSGLLLLDSGGGRHDLGDGARLESLCGVAVAEGLVASELFLQRSSRWPAPTPLTPTVTCRLG